MYFNEDKSVAYYAHPRTASKSTAEALKDVGFNIRGSHHFAPVQTPHCEQQDVRVPDCDVSFCVVRNHYDAFVSWAHHMEVPNAGGVLTKNDIETVFEEQKRFFNTEGEREEMWPYRSISDFVLRFEYFPECLHKLADKFDIGELDVPHHHNSKRDKSTTEELTQDARKFIEEHFSEEIAELRYHFQ